MSVILKKSSDEEASEIVIGAVLELGGHEYTSNWVVADLRYDVIIGVPWRVENDMEIIYRAGTILIPEADEMIRKPISKPKLLKITNPGIRRIGKLLKRSIASSTLQLLSSVQAYCMQLGNQLSEKKFFHIWGHNSNLDTLLNSYGEVFRDKLPD